MDWVTRVTLHWKSDRDDPGKRAMLNGSCLILAGNQMGQGAAHVQRKDIKLQSSPQKSFGLLRKASTSKQHHLCICLFIGINKNSCCLNSYFLLEAEEKNSHSIYWLSCAISPCFGFKCQQRDQHCHVRPLPSVLRRYLGTVCFWVTFHILHSSQSFKATNHPKRGRTCYPVVTTYSKSSYTLTFNTLHLCPLL